MGWPFWQVGCPFLDSIVFVVDWDTLTLFQSVNGDGGLRTERPVKVPVPILHTSGMIILPVSSCFPSLQNPGEEPGAGNTVSSLLHSLEEGCLSKRPLACPAPDNKEPSGSGSARASSAEQKAGKQAQNQNVSQESCT